MCFECISWKMDCNNDGKMIRGMVECGLNDDGDGSGSCLVGLFIGLFFWLLLGVWS